MTQDRRVAVIGLGYVGLPLAISFVEAGLRGRRHRRVRRPGRGAQRRFLPDRRHHERPPGRRPPKRPARPVAGGGGPRRRPTRSSCASRPRSPRRRTPTSPRSSRPPRRSAARCTRASSSSSSRRRSRARRPGPFREILERSGLKAGEDFDLAFAPERVNPGDPASASKGVPRLVGATTPKATQARRRAPREHQRPRHRDELARRGRAQQAPRERLPQRQHRVRQPARAAVRADGPRRVGGHRTPRRRSRSGS